jgi:type IV secretory pathway VirB4 component
MSATVIRLFGPEIVERSADPLTIPPPPAGTPVRFPLHASNDAGHARIVGRTIRGRTTWLTDLMCRLGASSLWLH